jgi:hypothetical protein
MTYSSFFTTWLGEQLDTDKFPAGQPYQCVDVANKYNSDVIGGPSWHGNAIDRWNSYPTAFYDRVENTVSGYPKPGDIVIWGKEVGEFGHIAICKEANASSFISFDQNWPLNTACHFQPHAYHGVLGWLTPKVNQPDMSQAEREELTSLRSFKDTVVKNKLCEYRWDPEATVYQVFAIPDERFFTDLLQNKWENVKIVNVSKYPFDIDQVAKQQKSTIEALQEQLKAVPATPPTPDPVTVEKEVPGPTVYVPTPVEYTTSELLRQLISRLIGKK